MKSNMYSDTISGLMTHAVPESGGSKGHASQVTYTEKSVVSAVIRRDETIEKDKPQVAHCSHVASLAAWRSWPRDTSKPLSY